MTSSSAKVLCVLHFTEVFDDRILDLRDASGETAQCIMQFCMRTYSSSQDGAGGDTVDLDAVQESLPLYQLAIGVSPSSEGIPCAASAGVNSRVLLRARDIKKSISERKELEPISCNDDGSLDSTPLRPQHIEGVKLLLSKGDWLNASKDDVDSLRSYFQEPGAM